MWFCLVLRRINKLGGVNPFTPLYALFAYLSRFDEESAYVSLEENIRDVQVQHSFPNVTAETVYML